MKKAKLIGGICLVLILAVSLSGCGPALTFADEPQDELPPGIEKKVEPVQAEISFEDGAPLIPNVRPVIILSGSDYDMGYQYSQEIVQIFGPWMLERIQRGEFTEKQITALKAYQWHIKEYTPEMIDFMKGMADGATDAGVELSYAEVLANATGTRSYLGTEPPGSEKEKLPPKCSAWAAWGSTTKDSKLICADSIDWEPSFAFTIVAFPETGNSFVMNTIGDSVLVMSGSPFMNDKGLVTLHGSGTSGNEERGYCTPFSKVHTVRFADNAAQALEMQLDYYPPGTRARGFWADTSGDAFNLDCRDPETVRRAGDNGEEDFMYSTNNCLVREGLEEFLSSKWDWELYYVPHGGWWGYSESSVQRNLGMWNMFHNYQGEVDLDFAKMMWRFPGELPDYPTLEEAFAGLYDLEGEGWDMKICNLDNEVVAIMLPEEGLFYVCTGCAARLGSPLGAGEYCYLIDSTHSFFELKLASSAEDVVKAARVRARFAMWDANLELGKLDYSDAEYAPLDALFNQAVTEWWKAEYFGNLGTLETTKEVTIYDMGKALRAFNKCQAYALQVYNALVPPANDPEDLSLGEWFSEDWGEWATIPHLEE